MRKRPVDIPLRVKIQQEQVRSTYPEPEAHKPANPEAEFKQSTQCCSQWGPTSRSRLWNVERSMIKTQSTQATIHIFQHTYSAYERRPGRPSDLCLHCAYWLTHRNVKFSLQQGVHELTYKFRGEWDVPGHQEQTYRWRERETDQAYRTMQMQRCYLLLWDKASRIQSGSHRLSSNKSGTGTAW